VLNCRILLYGIGIGKGRTISNDAHRAPPPENHFHTPSAGPVVLAISVILVLYAISTAIGWTQKLVSHGDHGGDDHAAAAEHDQDDGFDATYGQTHDEDHQAAAEAHGKKKNHPHYFAVIPFVLLLGAIAVLPLLKATEHWWESNRNRFLVAVVLGAMTLIYYGIAYAFVFEFEGGGLGKIGAVLQHAILLEYIPFIVLLFSLYTISGGIRIQGDVPAHPLTNTIFIGLGGLLASFIGTTGAAMLLIRPLLTTNAERKHVQHTVVFFIFVACNCGGCLLPIGDPPLFLGYLKGVNFLWTMWNLWAPWLVVNIILLVIYYIWDHFYCYPHEAKPDIRRDETRVRPIRVSGLWPNVPLLVGVILAVALLDPNVSLPGSKAAVEAGRQVPAALGSFVNEVSFKEAAETGKAVGWYAAPFLREATQIALVALSLLLGSHAVRAGNKFNYHAIVEVAALFIGIFVCMQPAIEILHVKGPQLPLGTPMRLFWATGSLSSVLDNAPTYVVFFETAASEYGGSKTFAEVVSHQVVPQALLIGISLGAVFMGAMTYIGNGPNFMVRAIAEQSGVKMPSFFGYVIRYSIPVLVPVFVVVTWFFLIFLQ